jgi:hypothetical protein
MYKILSSSLAVTALATAIAAPANAQSQTAYVNDPIAVKRFSANPDYAPARAQWFDGITTSASSDVIISFVDTAPVAATKVVFAVRSGGHTCFIVDKGTFSPGTRITHSFPRSAELDNASSIEVRKVTFADGTTWES